MRRPKGIPKPPKKPLVEAPPTPRLVEPEPADSAGPETPVTPSPAAEKQVVEKSRPKAKRKSTPTKASKAASKTAPKPVEAPIKATQKMVVYVSPETRQRVEATVNARAAAFQLDFTTLTAVVVAAFDWFFEGDVPLQQAVSKLNRNQAGEPPLQQIDFIGSPRGDGHALRPNPARTTGADRGCGHRHVVGGAFVGSVIRVSSLSILE